jgi:hypothetical protein
VGWLRKQGAAPWRYNNNVTSVDMWAHTHENENIVSENYESGIINLYYTQDIILSEECGHFLLACVAYKPWPLSARYLSDKIITYKKAKVHLEQALKAQRLCRGVASFFNCGAGGGWGRWLMSRPGRFTPGKETRYPLYRRPRGTQALAPTGTRSAYRPVRSESLYRLSHSGPQIMAPYQC